MANKWNVGGQMASHTKFYTGYYWGSGKNMNMDCLVTTLY